MARYLSFSSEDDLFNWLVIYFESYGGEDSALDRLQALINNPDSSKKVAEIILWLSMQASLSPDLTQEESKAFFNLLSDDTVDQFFPDFSLNGSKLYQSIEAIKQNKNALIEQIQMTLQENLSQWLGNAIETVSEPTKEETMPNAQPLEKREEVLEIKNQGESAREREKLVAIGGLLALWSGGYSVFTRWRFFSMAMQKAFWHEEKLRCYKYGRKSPGRSRYRSKTG